MEQPHLDGMDAGEIVVRVVQGQPPFERGSRLEPSLLPHLARLCHEASIGELLVAGDVFAGHPFHGWPQVRESVRSQLVARFTDEQLLRAGDGWAITSAELVVRRALLAQQPIDDAAWRQIDLVVDVHLRAGLQAIACSLDPDAQRGRLGELWATIDPAFEDIETVRVLSETSARTGDPPSVHMLAMAWTRYGEVDPIRVAHLLHLVPEADRPLVVAGLRSQLLPIGLPAWVVALYASRVAAVAPGGLAWPVEPSADPFGVWSTFLDDLATAGPATSEAATLRAHPFAAILERLTGPHEATVSAAEQMVAEFGGAAPASGTTGAEPDEGALADLSEDDGQRDGVSVSVEDADLLGPGGLHDAETGSDAADAMPPGDATSVETVPAQPPMPPASPPVPRESVGHTPGAPSDLRDLPTSGTRGPRRRVRRGTGTAAPETSPPPAADTRRLGVDVFADGRSVERALIRDRPHTVVVAVGHGARFQVDRPAMVPFAQGVEVRRLHVRLVFEGFDEMSTLTLRRDPSSEGQVSFELVPTGDRLSAMVIVYNEDRSLVIQAGNLTADIVASAGDEQTAPGSIRFEGLPAAPLGVERVGGGTVVTAGDQLAVSTHTAGITATVAGVTSEVTQVLEALQSAAGDIALAGADSPSFERALRGAARAGARLHSKLQLGQLDRVDRIQVVSITGETVLPLELVYDGPAPSMDAPLCKNWKRSLLRGRCASCDRRTGDSRAEVVCPMRFWGCRKVIEHHQGSTLGETEFAVRAMTGADAVALPRPTAALVGVSKQVDDALAAGVGPNTLEELLSAASELGKVARATDWTSWTSQVASTGATLLIAMPHQEMIRDNGVPTPALELGGVFETSFDEHFWRRAGEIPGPVLFLLGCNTAIQARAITSFASWFRQWTPVIVATIGEVIADEAPAVAATILDRFDKAWRRRRTSTVGESLRDTRQALLADSRLVGLQLVLHGEAAWQVGRKVSAQGEGE